MPSLDENKGMDPDDFSWMEEDDEWEESEPNVNCEVWSNKRDFCDGVNKWIWDEFEIDCIELNFDFKVDDCCNFDDENGNVWCGNRVCDESHGDVNCNISDLIDFKLSNCDINFDAFDSSVVKCAGISDDIWNVPCDKEENIGCIVTCDAIQDEEESINDVNIWDLICEYGEGVTSVDVWDVISEDVECESNVDILVVISEDGEHLSMVDISDEICEGWEGLGNVDISDVIVEDGEDISNVDISDEIGEDGADLNKVDINEICKDGERLNNVNMSDGISEDEEGNVDIMDVIFEDREYGSKVDISDKIGENEEGIINVAILDVIFEDGEGFGNVDILDVISEEDGEAASNVGM